jgi:hypothetical protein
MYIPFDQLSDQSPIWIYQADMELSDEQIHAIMQKTKSFLENWTSHGRALQASAEIHHRRFLILGIEKPTHDLSCCTVDSAIHFLREIKAALQVDFLKRNQMFFKKGEYIFTVPINQIKEQLVQGKITADMLMFDNTIMHKGGLVNKWLTPVQDSWLAK